MWTLRLDPTIAPESGSAGRQAFHSRLGLGALVWGLAAAGLSAGEPPTNAFVLHLPAAKLGYPGAEFWAKIERSDGQSQWSYARFLGQDRWTVPLLAGVAGPHRLVGVERRQGATKTEVPLGPGSQVRLIAQPTTNTAFAAETNLVEAGDFTTFFTAEEPWCINDHTLVQGPDRTWHLFGITHPKPLDFFKDPGRQLAHATGPWPPLGPWRAQPPAVTADWEKYREYLLWAPHVIQHQGRYYMFVCAGERDSHRYRLHLLTSRDLKDWDRHPDNPLVADGFDGRDPMVMPLQDGWVMYYTASMTDGIT